MDGSVIHLSSLTTLEVNISSKQRNFKLLRGEALFTVAKDKKRKFIVHTNNGRVEAIGTEFNINIESKRTVLTVLEGTVLVDSLQKNGRTQKKHEQVDSTIVTEFEQLLLGSEDDVIKIDGNTIKKSVAWIEGNLIFSGEPLHEALEKANLHSKHSIKIHDKNLKDVPLYGAFKMGDTEGLIQALTEALPIKAIKASENTTWITYDNKET